MIYLDRNCENPKCAKQLTVDEDRPKNAVNRSLRDKRFCDGPCASQGAALLREKETRFCMICGNPIPWVTNSGTPMDPSNYKHKKTCGDTECYRALRRMTGEAKGGVTNHSFHQTPDIIESWCLGGERTEPGGTGLIAIESMKQMMNSAINQRPWYGQEIQGA